MLNNSFGISFDDFYTRDGLLKLDLAFVEKVCLRNPDLGEILKNARNEGECEPKHLIELSIILEEFLCDLFLIKDQNSHLVQMHEALDKIYRIKRDFVRRRASKKQSEVISKHKAFEILRDIGLDEGRDIDAIELKIADEIDGALLTNNEEKLRLLEDYCIFALNSEYGKSLHKSGSLFTLPKTVDKNRLFDFEQHKNEDLSICSVQNHRDRVGFNLTDNGFSLNQAQGHANYCIFCHNQKKDSCRTGLKTGDKFIEGCPLDQKISEMNLLKSQGNSIASLAVITIDNPLVAGTGSRICNDCMKSCIYQKQEPVNIPRVETRILKDVLSLPYGLEIYSLLTRWNPLNFKSYLPKIDSKKRILVCGLGPAGYTLSHYLLNLGHEVVAIDGLKIEPLDVDVLEPIKNFDKICESLQDRIPYGFGGVSEYGITSRWDKNFLLAIRLILQRRSNFRMFGGIRFGSSITADDAFNAYGFDHIALCIGAGIPNILNVPGFDAIGVRSASDFLMSLNLGAAFSKKSDVNLQIRMPVLVVGGGLTAVDAATESLAYYQAQVENFAKKYDKVKLNGRNFEECLDEREKKIAQEFLDHAKILRTLNRKERVQFLKSIGGVKILYRKAIQDAPSYRINDYELYEGLREGIELVQFVDISSINKDENGQIKSVSIKSEEGIEVTLECGSLIYALGTKPNISPITKDGTDIKCQNGRVQKRVGAKFISDFGSNTLKSISFFGDMHEDFSGSVVKAMASAKIGSKEIDSELLKIGIDQNLSCSITKIEDEFRVRISSVKNISEKLTEIWVKSKLIARNTQIGHIFRFQKYSKNGHIYEQIPLTALSIDKELGLIKFVMFSVGAATSTSQQLKEGEDVVMMGPSGEPTELACDQNVMIVCSARGNVPGSHIAKEYKDRGCKVTLILGYESGSDFCNLPWFERASDSLIISTLDNAIINLTRENDSLINGEVTDAMRYYFNKNKSQKIDRVFAIGSDTMMRSVYNMIKTDIKEYFSCERSATASLNAPMQCMMKGVCSQCLQRRKTHMGYEYFYSCAQQDQDMDLIDFDYLTSRSLQNSVLEKISKFYLRP